jgi:hypothetical protein
MIYRKVFIIIIITKFFGFGMYIIYNQPIEIIESSCSLSTLDLIHITAKD